jgi:hypothetical protein
MGVHVDEAGRESPPNTAGATAPAAQVSVVLLLLTAGSSRELTHRPGVGPSKTSLREVTHSSADAVARHRCPPLPPHRRRAGRGTPAQPSDASEFLTGLREGPAPFSWPFLFSWSRRLPRRVRARSRRVLDRKAGGLSSFRVLGVALPRAERPSLSRAERNP